jgi:hypothetical protein
MARWIRLNWTAEQLLQRMGGGRRLKNPDYQTTVEGRFLRIDYDSFAARPREILSEVCQALGVNFEDDMLDYHKSTFHNISGSKSSGQVGPISSDQRWRADLPMSSRAIFALCGGKYWNRRFGVSDSR